MPETSTLQLLVLATFIAMPRQERSIDSGVRLLGAAVAHEMRRNHGQTYFDLGNGCELVEKVSFCASNAMPRTELARHLNAFGEGLNGGARPYSDEEVRSRRSENATKVKRDAEGRPSCVTDTLMAKTFYVNQVRIASDSLVMVVSVTEIGSIAGCSIGGVTLQAVAIWKGKSYVVQPIDMGGTWYGVLEVPANSKRPPGI